MIAPTLGAQEDEMEEAPRDTFRLRGKRLMGTISGLLRGELTLELVDTQVL